VRGPSPGSIASLEHHERYDYPGSANGGEASRFEPRSLAVPSGSRCDIRGGGYSHSVTDRSHQTGVACEDIHDVRYRNDDGDFWPATTDPYDVQRARSPGSRRSPVRGQSPDSRRSPTPFHNTTNSPDRSNQTERWREMLAGSDDSFQSEESSSQERVSSNSPARNTKRNAENYDQGPSWLLQQSLESAPDRTHMPRGRKTIRTHDGQMRDDMRKLSTSRHDNVQRSSAPARRVPDVYCERQHEHYRPQFAGEEDRITRVCACETTWSGVQHLTAHRAPSPYTQYGGPDSSNMNATSVANDQESLRREFFGQNNALVSRAPRQKRPEHTRPHRQGASCCVGGEKVQRE
jgi:hypothetical protein